MNKTLNLTLAAFIGLCLYLFVADVARIQSMRINQAIEAGYDHEMMCLDTFEALNQAIISQIETCDTDTECHDLALKYNIPGDCL